ncbi:MAG: NTP transferase domain-containing protein [Myxococcaceae bacterium]|nr:NTP transferase domain-containing protein [Myxococcaceae bacterium]
MNLTLAILAGGRASRFGGRDKGQLVYQGRTLLDRLLDLRAVCEATLIVRDDVVPGRGTPGGVVTALLRATTSYVLIVCCDMPFVTVEAVQPLLEVNGPAVFGDEPFPGVYPTALGPVWRDRLVTNPSMRGLLASEPFARLALKDPRVARSINTEADAKSHGVDIP